MERFCILFCALVFFASMSMAQQWTTYNKENSGLASNQVRSIEIDKNDAKWIGTASGLCRFDGTDWITYTTEDSLVYNHINSIAFENYESNMVLWLATDNGVSFVDLMDILDFTVPFRSDNAGLVSNTVAAVKVDQDHIKWFGTDSGLSAFDGQRWKTFTVADVLSGNRIKSIGISKGGWKYFGTKGGGVTRLHTKSLDAITTASPIESTWSGLLSDNVYAIFIDSTGVQWFGTDEGVSSHTGSDTKKNWNLFTAEDGLVHNFVQAICQDKYGVMWFGTRGGVSSFDGIAWKSYTTENGLAGNIVYDIAIGLDGSLWFATNAGVSNFTAGVTFVQMQSSFQSLDRVSIRNYPNPFNSQTTFEISIRKAGLVSLNIYNIDGQEIRMLVNNQLGSGIHRVRWDGKSDRGYTVPTGIYFVRITNGTNSVVSRMVVVR